MLVANHAGTDHATAIANLLGKAQEVTIAVAFLKRGGARLLRPLLDESLKRGAKVEVYVGTDFFLTEPEALQSLLKLTSRYSNCRVMVADQSSSTFHPKIYTTRIGDSHQTLIGSANLTAGGMSSNEELSLSIQHNENDLLTKQLAATFARYRVSDRFQELSPLFLQQYASRYAISEIEQKKFKNARDAALPDGFDLRTIDDWYAKYLTDPKAVSDLVERRVRQAEAVIVQKAIVALNSTALDRAARTAFQSGLRDLMTSKGGRHLWGSNAIYRQGSKALKHPQEMIALFAAAQAAAKLAPPEGYKTIRKLANAIPGVGINMATEILCTFAPKRYAVYNGNTVGALTALGIAGASDASFQTINPARYKNLCITIKALGMRIGGANFSEADAFLNWIYWKTKQNNAQ